MIELYKYVSLFIYMKLLNYFGFHLYSTSGFAKSTFSTSGSFNGAPNIAPPSFNAFVPVTEDEGHKFVKKSPTKLCLLDPMPTFLLKDCLGIPLPSITNLVNFSLIEGSFPNALKKAVVTPLIKKASLPKNDRKNYCPVSGLSFLSKSVERVAAKQLTSDINNIKLDNPHQSGYKPGHSSETALLSIKCHPSLFSMWLTHNSSIS